MVWSAPEVRRGLGAGYGRDELLSAEMLMTARGRRSGGVELDLPSDRDADRADPPLRTLGLVSPGRHHGDTLDDRRNRDARITWCTFRFSASLAIVAARVVSCLDSAGTALGGPDVCRAFR